MADGSLTVSRKLIEELKPEICCSESKSTCRDDEFCSSNPADWPVVKNGKLGNGEMVRIRFTGKGDKTKPAIKGTEGFCRAYTSWYTQTGCSALAAEIAAEIENADHCVVGINPRDFTEKILAGIPDRQKDALRRKLEKEAKRLAESYAKECADHFARIRAARDKIQNRCGILFEEKNGKKKFNAKRADDLNVMALRCDAYLSSIPPKGGDGGGGGGFGGILRKGGVAGGILLGLYVIYKAISAIAGGMKFAKTSSAIMSDLVDAMNHGAKATKKFFGVALPNFVGALKYAVTLKWLKGEKPPPNIAMPDDEPVVRRPTATPAPHVSMSHWDEETSSATLILPEEKVVRMQFESLVNSERYGAEGERFLQVSEPCRGYLVFESINWWRRVPVDEKEKYISDDDRLTRGKLPIGFLLKFAHRFLQDNMLQVVEKSSEIWAKEQGLFKGMRLLDTKARLAEDARYYGASAAAQDYTARWAISKWDEMPDDAKQAFVNQHEDVGSMLPDAYLESFREELRNIGEIEEKAAIYAHLIYAYPDLINYSFQIIDARISILRRGWASLLENAKREFWLVDGLRAEQRDARQMPASFIQFMHRALAIGIEEREATAQAEKPWDRRLAPSQEYMTFALEDVMQSIVECDPRMAFFPLILEHRARSTVDSWIMLSDIIKGHYMVEEGEAYDFFKERIIPASYARFWHLLNPDIAIGPRSSHPTLRMTTRRVTARKPGGDDNNGGAGGAPSGGAAPVAQNSGSQAAAALETGGNFMMTAVSAPPPLMTSTFAAGMLFTVMPLTTMCRF